MRHKNVPAELVRFVDFVIKWGAIESDTERYDLLDKAEADPSALKELESFAKSWTPELQDIFDEWADREPMPENETVARFYFTLLLLDELGFKVPNDEGTDPVAKLVAQLKKTGSMRKDSGRMWAARGLPDYGDDAKVAIPDLTLALDDRLPSVRIWAHYALARLTGEQAKHRAAIREIGAKHRSERLDADDALEVLNRTEAEHNVEALCGFCVLNDVRHIRRLLTVSDVNGIDHNGQRPLDYAVGNNHTSAVRLLLENGADPNLKHPSEDSPLHSAVDRNHAEIIALLVEYGADLNARDADGRTPLERAVELRLRKSAALLKKLAENAP